MRIMVQGHRGASAYAPENTLPAFKLAVKMGADGVENDIRFTKDGVIVVSHDASVDRMSTGTGLIRDMTYSELLEYDFGVKRGQEFAGTKICTLKEFLDIVKGMDIVNIEFKPMAENGPIDPDWAIGRMYGEVEAAGCLDRTIISSFDHPLLKRIKELHPDVRTALLYGHRMTPDETIAMVRSVNGDIIHPHLGCIDKEIVDRCREEGIQVNVWTVDAPEDVRLAVSYGVTGIITNVPDRVLKIVEEL